MAHWLLLPTAILMPVSYARHFQTLVLLPWKHERQSQTVASPSTLATCDAVLSRALEATLSQCLFLVRASVSRSSEQQIFGIA
eukprot:1917146-Amphidinium_carterae.1